MFVVVKFYDREPILEHFEDFYKLHDKYPNCVSTAGFESEEEANGYLEEMKKLYEEFRQTGKITSGIY